MPKISTSFACDSQAGLVTTGLSLPFTRTTVRTVTFGTVVLQIEKQTGLIYNLCAPFDHATVVSQLRRPIMSITQWGDCSLRGQSLKFRFQPTCVERKGRHPLTSQSTGKPLSLSYKVHGLVLYVISDTILVCIWFCACFLCLITSQLRGTCTRTEVNLCHREQMAKK